MGMRIKRRALGGASGAPNSLGQSELAYSEVDQILYIGQGAGGSATVVAIGGPGSYLTSATAASTYLTQSSASSTYAPLASPTLTGTPAAPTASAGTSTTQIATTAFVMGELGSYLTTSNASSTYLTIATASSTYAPLASPTFTGTPAAPTASAGTNTTQVATTAYVTTAISNLVNGAGAALDTLQELAAALGNDASFSTTITTSIGTKLTKASNLSDLTDASAARTNLGLGSIATQAANNVSITGGSIGSSVDIDGGTF